MFLFFFIFSIYRFIYFMNQQQRTPMRAYEPRPSRRQSRELADISGEIRFETEKAFRFYDGKITVWLPKSLCEWDEESKTMTIPEWLAIEKELI